MTNVNKARRHLSSDTACGFCGAHEESLLHFIHDCIIARNIWISIDASLGQCGFFPNSGVEMVVFKSFSSNSFDVWGSLALFLCLILLSALEAQ